MSYYHAVVKGVFNGEVSNPFITSFTYLTTELIPTSAGATVLGGLLADLVFNDAGPLAACTSTALEYQSVTVTSPPVPSVLGVTGFSMFGSVAGEYMPRFVSWGFRSDRTRSDIRSGFKRFGGVPETLVSNGSPTGPALTQLLGNATNLEEVLSGDVSGVGVLFTPIIVKRILYTAPSGRPAYRLPEGLDPFEYSPTTNWAVTGVTTQNSRKG